MLGSAVGSGGAAEADVVLLGVVETPPEADAGVAELVEVW